MTRKQVWQFYGWSVGGYFTYAVIRYLMSGSAYMFGGHIGIGVDIVVFGAIAAFITTRCIKKDAVK